MFLIRVIRVPPAATARCFNTDSISGLQFVRTFRWKILFLVKRVGTGCTVLASKQSVWTMFATIA